MSDTFWQISYKDSFSPHVATETFYSNTIDQAFESAKELVEQGKKVIISGSLDPPFPSSEESE